MRANEVAMRAAHQLLDGDWAKEIMSLPADSNSKKGLKPAMLLVAVDVLVDSGRPEEARQLLKVCTTTAKAAVAAYCSFVAFQWFRMFVSICLMPVWFVLRVCKGEMYLPNKNRACPFLFFPTGSYRILIMPSLACSESSVRNLTEHEIDITWEWGLSAKEAVQSHPIVPVLEICTGFDNETERDEMIR